MFAPCVVDSVALRSLTWHLLLVYPRLAQLFCNGTQKAKSTTQDSTSTAQQQRMVITPKSIHL